MAFSTQRGRPKKPIPTEDFGTPELRLKHALHLTIEPIDLCLEKHHITSEQHRAGLHLRWLHTLRYGAPNLTTHYIDTRTGFAPEIPHDSVWRAAREGEYHEAVVALNQSGHARRVMALAVYNELPVFLSRTLIQRACGQPALQSELRRASHQLCEGLEVLVHRWHRPRRDAFHAPFK